MTPVGISKPSPTFFAHFARNFLVFHQLPSVPAPHLRVGMTHPVVDGEIAAFGRLQDSLTESPERMKADAFPPHLSIDCGEAVPPKVLGTEHLAAFGLEQEARLAVADVAPQHLGAPGSRLRISGLVRCRPDTPR